MNPKLGIHLNLELGNKMTLELRNHLNFFTFYLGNNLVADTYQMVSKYNEYNRLPESSLYLRPLRKQLKR